VAVVNLGLSPVRQCLYEPQCRCQNDHAEKARRAGVGLSGAPTCRCIDKISTAPGRPDNPNGEWLEIVNEGSEAVDLTGFTVKDRANHIFDFPHVRLEPGQALRLYSGEGLQSSTALYWGLSGDSVWNNDGDTAYLRDAEGRLVDDYSY
jgi:micrococcal nuclease